MNARMGREETVFTVVENSGEEMHTYAQRRVPDDDTSPGVSRNKVHLLVEQNERTELCTHIPGRK